MSVKLFFAFLSIQYCFTLITAQIVYILHIKPKIEEKLPHLLSQLLYPHNNVGTCDRIPIHPVFSSRNPSHYTIGRRLITQNLCLCSSFKLGLTKIKNCLYFNRSSLSASSRLNTTRKMREDCLRLSTKFICCNLTNMSDAQALGTDSDFLRASVVSARATHPEAETMCFLAVWV